MKLAFAGFRHSHILGLYEAARKHPAIEVVAACEDDPPTRQALLREGKVALTHGHYADMLAAVDCDAVAIGDYYARRGEIAIAALRSGRHVISDKPICTHLGQLDEIESQARRRRLCLGCQLDLRDYGNFRLMRRLVREGAIGEVRTVCFTAQHPLRFGSRPEWYFEEGKQGGTINDIAVHGLDLIPWVTGKRFSRVVAARAWNARLPERSFFQDAAQMMLQLDNGGGVLGDVSYLAPDAAGYACPQYWRITCHGSSGVIETSAADRRVLVAAGPDKQMRQLEPEKDSPGGCLESFLREVAATGGHSDAGVPARAAQVADDISPTTEEVLAASRLALLVQRAADEGLTNVEL